MTDISVFPADGLTVVDVWDGALPEGIVGMRVGPRRWWVEGAVDAAVLGASGAATPIGGGWSRVRLSGADWRAVIMDGGLIDAEHPDFGPGTVVSTMLCEVHAVVRVVAEGECDVFVPSSLVEHCLGHWRKMGWGTGQP